MSTFFAIFIAIAAIVLLALLAGGILGFAAEKFKVDSDPIVEQLDALLPQTQCGQCGHPGCRPYAEAIANGEAINHCVPGGQDTINKISYFCGMILPVSVFISRELGDASVFRGVLEGYGVQTY